MEAIALFTHILFKNKIVSLVLGDYLISGEISTKGVRNPPSMVHATSPQLRRGCHIGF
jgi:hypothetical protein